MKLSEIYYNIETYLNKTNNGGVFSPREFNLLLKSITPDFLKKEAEQVMAKFGSIPKGLYSSKLLKEFRVSVDKTPAAGLIDITTLADAYLYFVSMYTTAENVGRKVKVNLVTDQAWEKINTNYLGKPTADYAVCRFKDGENIEIAPLTIGEVNFTYIKEPVTPFLDYYIDADDNIVFMEESASGVSVPAGGTTSGGVAGPTSVNSATVELEFSEDYHYQFMIRMLEVMGVRTDDGQLLQFSSSEEQKINSI